MSGQEHLDRFEQQADFVEATINLLNRLRDVSQVPLDVDICNLGLPSANNAENSAPEDLVDVQFVPASFAVNAMANMCNGADGVQNELAAVVLYSNCQRQPIEND